MVDPPSWEPAPHRPRSGARPALPTWVKGWHVVVAVMALLLGIATYNAVVDPAPSCDQAGVGAADCRATVDRILESTSCTMARVRYQAGRIAPPSVRDESARSAFVDAVRVAYDDRRGSLRC